MQELESILSEHYCFKGLEKKYLDMIVKKAAHAAFKEGDFIFHESDKADKFYIIEEGIVALETRLAPDRDPITIQMIGEGDVLGWGWLFPHISATSTRRPWPRRRRSCSTARSYARSARKTTTWDTSS